LLANIVVFQFKRIREADERIHRRRQTRWWRTHKIVECRSFALGLEEVVAAAVYKSKTNAEQERDA
jgi:hypothetical protein